MSESGRIRFLSPGGATLLATYFGSRRQADELPDSLARWVREHTDAGRDASRLPALHAPFVVERNGARLVVRLVHIARESLLLLEEPETRGTWRHLAPLGRSAGEARTVLERLREELTVRAAMPTEPASRAFARPRNEQPPAPAAHNLTPHEARVLGLLVEGHSYKSAAAALGSSVHTIAFHVKHIYGKLHVHSRAEAVAKALRDRIVQ